MAVRDFIGIIVVAAPLFAINQYIDSRIAVEWRSWLARRLINSYFASRSYFHLKTEAKGIDNPDQRICDDVRSYANSSVILAVGVLRQGFYCVAFAGLLASLAPKLVWFLFGYAAVGTWITSAGFGKKLTNLSFSLLQREADLRFDLVRVREHAERYDNRMKFQNVFDIESKIVIEIAITWYLVSWVSSVWHFTALELVKLTQH